MTRRQRTLLFVTFLVTGIGAATILALRAFDENLLYFISPSEVAEGKAPAGRAFRLGGMVEKGSVEHAEHRLRTRFVITDFAHRVTVQYDGILPDLFREGQGIIARGRLDRNGVFVAEEVLAKHDENYMPPEVAGSLKQAERDGGAKP
ncbi:MAG: cytochrome c maturation protein CcmE [Gammaproteobacteria bacterium]|nr:MAG: cytochrome c maturation protein CcmE [Gammaproteobacteria bacterium]